MRSKALSQFAMIDYSITGDINQSTLFQGGSVAEWLACWTQAQ